MAELHGTKIFVNGELTIVTFDDKGYLGGQTFLGDAADHLEQIVEKHNTKVLMIDLSGITALPSLMMGILVGLHNHRGVRVRLFNITEDVQLILETMNLLDIFDVREGDLTSLIDEAEQV